MTRLQCVGGDANGQVVDIPNLDRKVVEVIVHRHTPPPMPSGGSEYEEIITTRVFYEIVTIRHANDQDTVFLMPERRRPRDALKALLIDSAKLADIRRDHPGMFD